MIFDEIHSAHSIWPYSRCSLGTEVRRTGKNTNTVFGVSEKYFASDPGVTCLLAPSVYVWQYYLLVCK